MAFELNEIANRTVDWVAGAIRTIPFPASSKQKSDETDFNTIYLGIAAAGTADNSPTWFLEKVVISGRVTTYTHATDSWDNRSTATYS